MAKKLALIFTTEQMERLEFANETIYIDLHGLGCKAAYWFLKCIIGMCMAPTHLIVIHGYNHGTALKEMINTYHLSDKVTSLSPDKSNLGRTHIFVG